MVYAGRQGHAVVDQELYSPRSWTGQPDRCRAAGLPEETRLATKPELAARVIIRFLDAGHQAAWITGDEVYGGNPRLRGRAGRARTGYVHAVACSHEVTTQAGKFRTAALAKKMPKRAWQNLSAGVGAKGHRAAPHQTTSSRCCNEIQRLFIALVVRPFHNAAHRLDVSH